MSRRQEILSAFVTELENTGEFTGGVYRKFVTESDVSEFPVAMVLSGDATYTPYTSGRYEADAWDIHVLILAKVETDIDNAGTLNEELERLVDVVVKAILDDPTLGYCFVTGLHLSDISRVYLWDENVGTIEIIFRVKYDFEKTNP